MNLRHALSLLILSLPLAAFPAPAQTFKFSEQEAQDKAADKAEADARQGRIAADLATPCRADLKGKKIMVIIGEVQSNGFIAAQQQNYGPHFQAINSRLRSLGLRTYTPEEIRAQIAQAEIDAYFRNDPDAALAASKKLGASFVLKGLITAQAAGNLMIPVNQVSVGMTFTLTGANGRTISTAERTTSASSTRSRCSCITPMISAGVSALAPVTITSVTSVGAPSAIVMRSTTRGSRPMRWCRPRPSSRRGSHRSGA